MGFVWNVLLSFHDEELWVDGEEQNRNTCEPLERINAWIPNGKLVSLVGPTFRKGSGFGLDANLYGGGFKHFDIDSFIQVVSDQDWKERGRVQLWLKGGEEGANDECFELCRLRPRRAKKRTANRASRKARG